MSFSLTDALTGNAADSGIPSDKLGGAFEKILAERGPQIASLLKEKLGPEALAEIEDDAKVTAIAGHMYEMLPSMLKMIVKEDAFTTFVLTNRTSIAEKLMPYLQQAA